MSFFFGRTRLQYNITAIIDIKIITLIIGITIYKTKFLDEDDDDGEWEGDEHCNCKLRRLYIPEFFLLLFILINKT
jgi:hypothetical protein